MISAIEQLADSLEKLGRISLNRGGYISAANKAVRETMGTGTFKRPPFTTLQDRLVVPYTIAIHELVTWLEEQDGNLLEPFDEKQGTRLAAALRRLNVSTLSESQQAALDYIREHPGAMGKNIAPAIGVEEITFRNHIAPKLKTLGVVNVPKQGYFPPGHLPPPRSTPKTRKRR